MKILVVEDEPLLRDGLVDLLGSAGHEVRSAGDGATGLDLGLNTQVDLVVLDVMLPQLDGLSVCKKLRQVKPQLPILMLTARGSEDDKVNGLTHGADDYVTKPFGARELLARVEALGRRAHRLGDEVEQLEVDGMRIDLGRLVATRDGVSQSLTPREVGILRCLYQHRARAVTRSELLQSVWGMRGDLQTRTVDMAIAKLRQKIERDPAHPRVIVTVIGAGYGWGNEA
jgi:DNA-binding response OmpR family regulator